MDSTRNHASDAAPALAAAAPASHPTPCPSWCRDRRHPAGHHFGPTVTWHWGQRVRLANPDPLPDTTPVILRAELFRNDEDGELGVPSMYLSGETDVEMGAAEIDVFLVQLQAFVDSVRVMRRQMG
jgi:hypothetical protein